ncbi:MAG: hypothetical protein HY698_17025 [Deltaproteobacteria bacterium]|nr:hypothetical protein [Deltaproteobacteria bacterium]
MIRPNGTRTPSGGLLNVGEKSRPRNGQVFIRYSGLWGSPGTFFGTSGYWGPAFNETAAKCGPSSDHENCAGRVFHTAWCAGMAGNSSFSPLDLNIECYADASAQL